MSRTKDRCTRTDAGSAILREVETNRLVRIMDSEDEFLYKILLRQSHAYGAEIDVVPGISWGESGLVYAATR